MTVRGVHVERSVTHRLYDDAALSMGETLCCMPRVDHQANQVIRAAIL